MIGRGDGTPLQYSCLENPMDGGAWWATVHGVTKSRTWLSDFTFTFHFQALEKEMATHSSVLAWRIPGTGEPGGLPSMRSHRVGHDWSDLAAATLISFREKGSGITPHDCQRSWWKSWSSKTDRLRFWSSSGRPRRAPLEFWLALPTGSLPHDLVMGWGLPCWLPAPPHSSILAWRIPWTDEPGLKSQTRLSD